MAFERNAFPLILLAIALCVLGIALWRALAGVDGSAGLAGSGCMLLAAATHLLDPSARRRAC